MLYSAVTVISLIVLAFIASISGEPLPSLTFTPPFEHVNSAGRRQISESFTYGGATDVKKNFIRLTPDRQSKRGFIWSQQLIDRNELTTILTFRIHGQGKKWFGDGIGLWFTTEARYQNGENHGFTDTYTGFGIVLDTFENVDHKGGHKDVTLQINDGTKRLTDFHNEVKSGCDASFRYHTSSATFDPVYSSSRLRVKVKGTAVEVQVDSNNSAHWEDCFQATLPFQNDWLRRVSFGITASTGALADNHDILRVQSYSDMKDHEVLVADRESWLHSSSKDFPTLFENINCDQTCKVAVLDKFVTNFQVETEHWFELLQEETENTIAKLKESERENERKILALTDHMTSIMERKIGQKMAVVRSNVNEKIAVEIEGELTEVQSSWRLPFFFLLVLIASGVGVAYQKYRKLLKSHLY
ncbi:hypothetical protein CCR75_002909 [Bremia lactucae]|uniref:L-type lectin-like domain-containing protein n=1 Tax=Bremia lactucae TaxID=4779 RepID=A0A976FQH8_BRELC|nr:hypothetical protein CCR75_002909 [Bremia lactucae]